MNASSARLLALAATLAPAADQPGMPGFWRLARAVAAGLRALAPAARLVIASGAVMSLDREDAEQLAEATLVDLRRGAPVPPFGAVEEEARCWASFASRAELESYAAAALYRLPPARRRAILAAVERRERTRETGRAA